MENHGKITIDDQSTRRMFLKSAGAASGVAITGLAGCAQRNNSGSNGNSSSGNGGSPPETMTGGNPGSSNGAPNKIRIGMTNALSGSNADTGELYQRAYKMALKDINNGSSKSPYSWDGGGIYLEKYDKRVPVKMFIRDSQSAQDRAVNQYKQLISQEKIHAAIAPYSSSVTFAVGSVLEENNIPWIAGAAADPKIYDQGWKTAFTVELPVTQWSAPQAQFLTNIEPKPEFIAASHTESTVNTTGTKSLVKLIKQKSDINIEIVGSYPPDTSDLSSVIQKGISKGADVFLNNGHVSTDTTFVRQVASLGAQPKAIGVGLSIGIPGFQKALGKQSKGVHGPQLWHPALTRALSYRGAKQFVSRYESKFNQSPDYHIANGFDSVNILCKAIEKAGAPDSNAIIKQLSTASFDTTLRGKLTFNKKGILQGAGALTGQLQGSNDDLQLEIISPKDKRTAEPLYPL